MEVVITGAEPPGTTIAASTWAPLRYRVFLALWWIPAGHIPTVDEAKKRLALLEAHGPTPFAFTFKTPFEPVIAPWPPASVSPAAAGDVLQVVPRGTVPLA